MSPRDRRLTRAERWRVFVSNRLAVWLVLIGFLFLALLIYQLAHGRPTCRAPSVPVSEIDGLFGGESFARRIGRDDWDWHWACITVGDDAAQHGLWIDSGRGALYYPNATTLPPGGVPETDAWLFMDRATRAAIRAGLPAADRSVGYQVIAISFFGSEYVLDEPTPDGLKRLYDVREVRSARLLSRQYLSARTPAARAAQR